LLVNLYNIIGYKFTYNRGTLLWKGEESSLDIPTSL